MTPGRGTEDERLEIVAAELAIETLKKGQRLRYTAHGMSMTPFIRDGDRLTIEPLSMAPRVGQVVLCQKPPFGFVHRIIACDDGDFFCLQGDNLSRPDGWYARTQLMGKVVGIERDGQPVPVLEHRTMVYICDLVRTLRKTATGARLLRGFGHLRRLRMDLLRDWGSDR